MSTVSTACFPICNRIVNGFRLEGERRLPCPLCYNFKKLIGRRALAVLPERNRNGRDRSNAGYVFAIIDDEFREAPNALALTYGLTDAMTRFIYVFEFTSAHGDTEPIKAFGSNVTISPNEDICALADLTLANPLFARLSL